MIVPVEDWALVCLIFNFINFMRALHVFPLFGPELVTGGSEYYEYMITKKLVELGVDVDVFTTCSSKFRPTAAFSLRWDSDYKERYQKSEGINIHRFPTTFSMPTIMGHAVSWSVFSRWKKEEEKYGIMLKGSKNLVNYYYLRAISRPLIYDWLTLLGRGPHPLNLLAAVVRSIQRYDIILVGFMPFAVVWHLTLIARFFKKPIVMLPLFHPEDLYHHFRIFYRCFLRADGILAQTSYSTRLFREFFRDSNPVEIGVGVGDELVSSRDISGQRFRSKYGLADTKLVLFVGRKELGKRYDLAVRAIDLIDHDRIKLIIIGTDVDRKPITSPHVLYLGNVTRAELVDAYDACDIFLLPSEHESFGIVFLEAWARKKPVIGNAFCAPVASIIKNGEDGFLCGDAEEIACKILELLSEPSKANKMGEAGYSKVIGNYTWDIIGKKIYDFYKRILEGEIKCPAS